MRFPHKTNFEGLLRECPYNVGAFLGAVLANGVLQGYKAFVQSEVDSLITRGWLTPWADGKALRGPSRPRLIQPVLVTPVQAEAHL